MLDLHTLRLQPGDVHRQTLRVHLGEIVLGGQTYRLEPDDPAARLEIQPASGGLYLKLSFDTTVVGPCFRCLEDARMPVSVAASEYHDGTPDEGAEEDMTSDYLHDDQLDVEQWARDSLMFALPDKILDRPDCLGLCAVCGRRLVEGDDHHHDPGPDDRWSALRELL
jgi:uncharacterized protein